MSRNRAVAEAFGARFDPPLVPVAVRTINGAPHRDAWMVAAFDQAAQAGITAHAYAGQLHAFIEVLAPGGDGIGRIGALFAETVQKLKDEHQQVGEGPAEGHPQDGRPQEGHAEQGDADQAPPQG